MIRIFEPDEIREMIRERIARDVVMPFEISSVQITVEKPFGADMKVHNEVPCLFVRFSVPPDDFSSENDPFPEPR